MTKQHGRLLVFIDGECAVCTITSSVLNATDRARTTNVVDYHEDASYRARGIDDAAAASSLHVIDTTTGEVYAGFSALRRLAREVTLLWPLRPVFALLAAIGLGDKLYAFVAKHRPTKRRRTTSNV